MHPYPPGLFKEQQRKGRNTWPAATSSWGLRAGGRRLLSIHSVRDNQTGSQAEKSNHNATKHHVSLKTDDRNFEARRFNIHRVLGDCSQRMVRHLKNGWWKDRSWYVAVTSIGRKTADKWICDANGAVKSHRHCSSKHSERRRRLPGDTEEIVGGTQYRPSQPLGKIRVPCQEIPDNPSRFGRAVSC